jgi:hypothetical protein
MPKHNLDILDLPQEEFATQGEAEIDLAGLRRQREPASVWTPRLTPILTLLQEVLADLFEVRDHALQAQRRGGKPARGVLRQYERDLQWLTSPEEQGPFSFGWVCHTLGLEASAVRRRYLSGQPVSLPRHHRVGITSGSLRLESVPRRASAGKVHALGRRHKGSLNGRHDGNGTDPTP